MSGLWTKLGHLTRAAVELEKRYDVDSEIALILVRLYARDHVVWDLTVEQVAEEVWETTRCTAIGYQTTEHRGGRPCTTRMPAGRASRRHPS